MTGDEYVASIIAKYAVPRGPGSAAVRLATSAAGPIRAWAGAQLNSLEYSGSYAKETGVHGVSDVDLFISFKENTAGTLRDLFEGAFAVAQENGWAPRRQNVSIGITVDGITADLVPGRLQPGSQNYHSLYLRKRESWTQTNVALHVTTVGESGRLREIRALKVWRVEHGLDWPSLYLELFAINALSGRSRSTLADNVFHVFREIAASISTTRLLDPSNSNNVISDDLTLFEKNRLAAAARDSLQKPTWEEIIW